MNYHVEYFFKYEYKFRGEIYERWIAIKSEKGKVEDLDRIAYKKKMKEIIDQNMPDQESDYYNIMENNILNEHCFGYIHQKIKQNASSILSKQNIEILKTNIVGFYLKV